MNSYLNSDSYVAHLTAGLYAASHLLLHCYVWTTIVHKQCAACACKLSLLCVASKKKLIGDVLKSVAATVAVFSTLFSTFLLIVSVVVFVCFFFEIWSKVTEEKLCFVPDRPHNFAKPPDYNDHDCLKYYLYNVL